MDDIDKLLIRGVANIIPDKKSLEELLKSGKNINIYLGIDPTSPKIHLGHAVSLRKIAKFADLGCNVTFLIGDFTALIGDTSDKNSERPSLTKKEVESNFKTYKKQAEKILDFSKVSVRYNSEWLSKLGLSDVLNLIKHFSLGDFIGRELIKRRLSEGGRIGLIEVIYPVMQGYDSYFLDTDLQIGGTDQIFNMQAGRTLQKNLRNKDSFILTIEFLEGTDGRKMSKSWGNAIWLEDSPADMFAKVMAIKDELIVQYFTLATDVSFDEVKNIKLKLEKGENPMELKKQLAFQIVTELYSKNQAETAAENFEKTVQNREAPAEIQTFELESNEKITISDMLVKSGLAESKSEAKRLVEQDGVAVNDKIIDDPNAFFVEGQVRVGKRKFLNIKLK